MHISSYSSIYNIGHKALEGFFNEEVEVTVKIDGSQISFSKNNNQYHARSKGQDLNIEYPEKLFQKAIDSIKTLDLKEGWIYRGEYLSKPKHNSISYDRVPNKHIILFGVDISEQNYLPYEEMLKEGERIGLEVVPLVFKGKINDIKILDGLLNNSINPLGKSKNEGVVLKRFDKFGPDKKILMAKYVSEEFRELHQKEWKKTNPTKKDIVDFIIEKYKTEARYLKAVQHLRDDGELTNSPKDIGGLLKEVEKDIEKEEKEEIKEILYKFFFSQIFRGIKSGLPEWYKNHLKNELSSM